MNVFWGRQVNKLGLYNSIQLREKLGLSKQEFDTLMALETTRYKTYVIGKYSKKHWDAKVKENPLVDKYGFTPMFSPYPGKTASYIFNDESGVFLEKTWSNKNKHNIGKSLPFDFVYKS